MFVKGCLIMSCLQHMCRLHLERSTSELEKSYQKKFLHDKSMNATRKSHTTSYFQLETLTYIGCSLSIYDMACSNK